MPHPPTPPQAPDRAVMGLLLAIQVAFASLSVVGKVTVGVVPWPMLMLLRTLGAFALFAVWSRLDRAPLAPPRALWGRAAVLGFLGVFANQSLFLAGLARTTAINATVLTATIPIFTALFSVFTGREPLRRRFVGGMAIALAGLGLVLRPERVSLHDGHLAGDLLIVTNCCAYGVYLGLARETVLRHGGLAVVRWAFLAGALFALPVGLPTALRVAPTLDRRAWAALGYIVAVPTAFTYGGNAWALGRVPASVVSVFVYLQPVFAVLFAVTLGAPLARWLGVSVPAEVLTPSIALGGLLTLAGVFAATRTAPQGRA